MSTPKPTTKQPQLPRMTRKAITARNRAMKELQKLLGVSRPFLAADGTLIPVQGRARA